MALSLGLVLGSLMGNSIDRVLFGHVTDFIEPGAIVIFNVADIALPLSAVGASAILSRGRDARRGADPAPRPSGVGRPGVPVGPGVALASCSASSCSEDRASRVASERSRLGAGTAV
jgi:hypothetical protein